MDRQKLFTTKEIILTGMRLSNGVWPFSRAEIAKHGSAEGTILHRSIYRDYFSMAFKDIMATDAKPSDEEYDVFFDNFVGYFLNGLYDFETLAGVNTLAKEKGWVNPFGWDSDTGKFTVPMTRLFRSSLSLSYLLQNHYERAVSGAIALTEYEQAVVCYIRDALQETSPVPPIYEALIQTQSQIAEYAIRLRSEFESSQGRPMLRKDWDAVSGDVYRMAMKRATISRAESYIGGMFLCFGEKPFQFQQEAEGKLSVSERSVDRESSLKKIDSIGMSEYLKYHLTRPATGCPVLRSNTGAGMNLVGFAIQTFMKAVANDFWPMTNITPAPGCPFHPG